MNTVTKASFLKRWKLNTILAYFIGLGILHPLIAHGITGDHEKMLTTPEFIMHCISLVCFAFVLTGAQNKGWQLIQKRKLFTGLLPMLLLIFAAFWFGYYTLYIPFDILFMVLAIGTVNAVAFKAHLVRPTRWVWQSLLAHVAGAVAGILVGLGGYLVLFKDLTGLLRDFTVWIGISVPAGITIALMSGLFLSRQIPVSSRVKDSIPPEGSGRLTAAAVAAELA